MWKILTSLLICHFVPCTRAGFTTYSLFDSVGELAIAGKLDSPSATWEGRLCGDDLVAMM